jgi:hypothetical protein
VNLNLEGTMKLKELRSVAGEACLIEHILIMKLRRDGCETELETLHCKLGLADISLLQAEIKEHKGTLEQILTICETVGKGRYLEDWQRCSSRLPGYTCEHACTSSEQCDGFSDNDPYQAILFQLDELPPMTDELKRFIVAQLDLQRSRRELLHGPDGILGGAKFVMHTENDEGVLVPMSEEESAAAMAAYEAQEDTKNESMGLRVHQYELNLQHIRRLCETRGALTEVVSIIEDGMPPTLRQPLSQS